MHRYRGGLRRPISIGTLVILCISCTALADDEDGFVSLFNGKDLAGWVNVNCAPSTFTVKDNQIITTGIPTGVLRTERQYENFILELDWIHIVPGGNSGLFVWSDAITAPGQPFTRAFECQILDGHETPSSTSQGDVFAIHGSFFVPDRPHPAGWMRCLPSEARTKPAGQWNHYRVECNDGVLKLGINGKVVSGGSKSRPRKGYICLEAEGSECHFKNLRIKELPSTNPKPEEIARTDEGFKSLYSGVDLSGWTGDLDHWSPKDWILNNDGKDAADKTLWSEKEYGDFQMIADWRLPAGKSAILLRGSPKATIELHSPAGAGSGTLSAIDAAPKVKADNRAGQWNRFVVTMKKNRVTIELNGKTVIENAQIASVADKGRIGLRAQGSAVQFGNIYVRELQQAK
ncbi:MAG TPA: DUF1080 domain-containing protein [Humisphaera sp.]|jgi:hypothetical protein|nr:DUF1080 domain-containing protein [Humisphaera sp.]